MINALIGGFFMNLPFILYAMVWLLPYLFFWRNNETYYKHLKIATGILIGGLIGFLGYYDDYDGYLVHVTLLLVLHILFCYGKGINALAKRINESKDKKDSLSDHLVEED